MKNRFIVLLIVVVTSSIFLSPAAFADDPKIETNPAENIRYTQAALFGATDTGDIDVSFEYKKFDEGTWVSQNVDLEGRGKFNKTIHGLESNTTYEFRAVGEYNGSRQEGDILNFTTSTYPKVETNNAKDITHISANLQGNLTEMGIEDDVDAYFNWTQGGMWNTTEHETVGEEGLFTRGIEGLDHETTYTFKAIVEWNDGNITEGEEETLETKPEIYVDTLDPVDVTTNSAVIRGELLGNETTIEDEETNVSFWLSGEFEEICKGNMDSSGVFEETWDDLEPETNYTFQAEVHRQGDTYEGKEITFMTAPEFSIGNLEADPDEVYVDEDFDIDVELENSGTEDFEYEVLFYVDDGREDTVKVEVEGGETETVSMTTSIGSSGTYDIEVEVFDESTDTTIEVYKKPDVKTLLPNEVGSDYAVLRGEVVELGMEDEVTVFFRYGYEGTDEEYWGSTGKQEMDDEDVFEIEITIDGDEEYEYKAVIEWSNDESTGSVLFLEPDSCEYKVWENQTCGDWECDEDEIYQTKDVTEGSPDFCEDTRKRCLEAEDYCGIANISLDLQYDIINITQGQWKTNNVTVENKGTEDLYGISMEINGDVPEDWFEVVTTEADIYQRESVDLMVNFTLPDDASVDKYTVVYSVDYGTTEEIEGELWVHPDEQKKEKIKTNYNNTTEGIEEIEERVDEISESLETEQIEEDISSFNEFMAEAQGAMNRDDYVTAKEMISKGESTRMHIEEELQRLEEEMAFPWLWIGVGILLITVAGVIIYMLMPPLEEYTYSKGYKGPEKESLKDRIIKFLKSTKEKILGEEDEGYTYRG